MNSTDQEREAFEKAFPIHCKDRSEIIPDLYAWPFTQGAWEGWQARAQQPASVAVPDGLHAIHYRDNWDGEGETYYLIARKEQDGRWLVEETEEELLQHEGDAILQAWPLTDTAAAPHPVSGEQNIAATLLDPEAVLVNMLRGTIAIPSVRSWSKLFGDVINDGDKQLLEIARLRAATQDTSDIEAMVTMLENREWAEHVGVSALGQRLEAAITALLNESYSLDGMVNALERIMKERRIGHMYRIAHDTLAAYRAQQGEQL